MTFKLGKRSLSRLDGVHPDLVRVVKKAIGYTPVDFAVLEGVRSIERQRRLFEAKASKTLNSRHLTGHAVDLGAYLDGEIRWDWPLYFQIADAMRLAALEEEVSIIWGADWDNDGDTEDEKFRDGPHFELSRKVYS